MWLIIEEVWIIFLSNNQLGNIKYILSHLFKWRGKVHQVNSHLPARASDSLGKRNVALFLFTLWCRSPEGEAGFTSAYAALICCYCSLPSAWTTIKLYPIAAAWGRTKCQWDVLNASGMSPHIIRLDDLLGYTGAPSLISVLQLQGSCKHACFNIILPSCDPEPVLINMIVRKAVGLLSVHSLIPAESQRAAIKSISVCHRWEGEQ